MPIDRKKLIDVILQCVQDRTSKPEPVQTEMPRPLSLQGCRILLAEDNPSVQALVAGILKQAGAEITPVKDGKLALDAALAARDDGNPFDIILMDIQMPIMCGDVATSMLRDKGYTGKIISLTAETPGGDPNRHIAKGFDASVWKPINRARLIETIQRLWLGVGAVPEMAT